MEKVFRNFYRKFYLKTGGYIPTKSLDQHIYPGDFFQIRNGEIIVLGNIFMNNIVNRDEQKLDYQGRLNHASWSFGDGVTKPYSGRSSGQGPVGDEFEFSKQILAFSDYGSFLFKGDNPETIKITNWNDLQQQLIIKLTQTIYSFRELYLATEAVTLSAWTLAVAGSDKAELEIATDSENFGLGDIFGHHSAKTIQSKDIEFYQHEDRRKPCFFKAKKLVVQDERLDVFISDLLSQRLDHDEWANGFFDRGFDHDPGHVAQIPAGAQASILDMLQTNQLNPNTALLYFRWADASLDDLEKLFINYGDE